MKFLFSRLVFDLGDWGLVQRKNSLQKAFEALINQPLKLYSTATFSCVSEWAHGLFVSSSIAGYCLTALCTHCTLLVNIHCFN